MNKNNNSVQADNVFTELELARKNLLNITEKFSIVCDQITKNVEIPENKAILKSSEDLITEKKIEEIKILIVFFEEILNGYKLKLQDMLEIELSLNEIANINLIHYSIFFIKNYHKFKILSEHKKRTLKEIRFVLDNMCINEPINKLNKIDEELHDLKISPTQKELEYIKLLESFRWIVVNIGHQYRNYYNCCIDVYSIIKGNTGSYKKINFIDPKQA